MYLCQQLDDVYEKHDNHLFPRRGTTLIVYRVELDAAGRPAWKMHANVGPFWGYHASQYARRYKRANVPFIQSAAHGKLVTMSEAVRLTGYLAPAALDYLTEQACDSPVLQNYVRPKPVRAEKKAPEPPAKLTPAQRAQAKLDAANAKVAEWEARQRHTLAKVREWRKRASQHAARVRRLMAEEVVS